MIKTIFFDLGGVLFTNGTKRFSKEISDKYGLDFELVMNVMDGELGSKYREHKISTTEFWTEIKKVLNLIDSIDSLNNQWIDGYELIDGTRDIILELKKNYKINYLSDNVRERVERINNKYKFLDWFDGGVFSYEANVRKPDPEIYKLALQKANTSAYESLFIDDKLSALNPAIELGFKTILFKDPNQLKKDLLDLNILI